MKRDEDYMMQSNVFVFEVSCIRKVYFFAFTLQQNNAYAVCRNSK